MRNRGGMRQPPLTFLHTWAPQHEGPCGWGQSQTLDLPPHPMGQEGRAARTSFSLHWWVPWEDGDGPTLLNLAHLLHCGGGVWDPWGTQRDQSLLPPGTRAVGDNLHVDMWMICQFGLQVRSTHSFTSPGSVGQAPSCGQHHAVYDCGHLFNTSCFEFNFPALGKSRVSTRYCNNREHTFYCLDYFSIPTKRSHICSSISK